jgi:hypothetical protein
MLTTQEAAKFKCYCGTKKCRGTLSEKALELGDSKQQKPKKEKRLNKKEKQAKVKQAKAKLLQLQEAEEKEKAERVKRLACTTYVVESKGGSGNTGGGKCTSIKVYCPDEVGRHVDSRREVKLGPIPRDVEFVQQMICDAKSMEAFQDEKAKQAEEGPSGVKAAGGAAVAAADVDAGIQVLIPRRDPTEVLIRAPPFLPRNAKMGFDFLQRYHLREARQGKRKERPKFHPSQPQPQPRMVDAQAHSSALLSSTPSAAKRKKKAGQKVGQKVQPRANEAKEAEGNQQGNQQGNDQPTKRKKPNSLPRCKLPAEALPVGTLVEAKCRKSSRYYPGSISHVKEVPGAARKGGRTVGGKKGGADGGATFHYEYAIDFDDGDQDPKVQRAEMRGRVLVTPTAAAPSATAAVTASPTTAGRLKAPPVTRSPQKGHKRQKAEDADEKVAGRKKGARGGSGSAGSHAAASRKSGSSEKTLTNKRKRTPSEKVRPSPSSPSARQQREFKKLGDSSPSGDRYYSLSGKK